MNTFTLCRALLLIGTIFISQSYGAEQEMRNLIEQKKIGRYGPSETFIRFSRIFDNSTPNDKATLVKIYEKLKKRDGDDSAIATIATEYGGQNVGEFAKKFGVEVAAIGARAYEHPDADWHRKPAAAPYYPPHNPNAAVEQEMLNLANRKAEGSSYTGRNATIDAFIATYGRLDPATKEKIVKAYTKLKERDGIDSAIAGMANDIKRNGLDEFLRDNSDVEVPVAAPGLDWHRPAVAAQQYPAARAAAETNADRMIAYANELSIQTPDGQPSRVFTDFIRAFERLDPASQESIVSIFEKFVKEERRDRREALTSIAHDCRDEQQMRKFIRQTRGIESENPIIKKLERERAEILGRNYAAAKEAIDRYQYPGAFRRICEIEAQIRAEEEAEREMGGTANRMAFLRREEARAAGEADRARRIAEEENDRLFQQFLAREEVGRAPHVDFGQDFGVARDAHGRGYEYPVAAPAPALKAPVRPLAAVPAPQADTKFEEFNHPEQQIIEAAYLQIMNDLQQENAARIDELEKAILHISRVRDMHKADNEQRRNPGSQAQIDDCERELVNLNREKDQLVKASAETMDRYAEAFGRAATPVLKAQTEGVQVLMRNILAKGQDISYGKILGYLQDMMGW